MKAISLLLADDHLLLRDTLAAVLVARLGCDVTLAATLQETLAAIAGRGAAFDIVLLDIVMPGMNGIAGVGEVVRANQGGAVVVMSGNVPRGLIDQALELGVRGFVPKTLAPAQLGEALQHVTEGGIYLPQGFRDPVLSAVLPGLTPQETRVLRHLCEGLSNKEIARAMELTEITIKTHMRAVCVKLGAKNRTQAALYGAARLAENDAAS